MHDWLTDQVTLLGIPFENWMIVTFTLMLFAALVNILDKRPQVPTRPLLANSGYLLWNIPYGVPPKSVTLTTYQAKGATLKSQRDHSPKRVKERGQYQTMRPPTEAALSLTLC